MRGILLASACAAALVANATPALAADDAQNETQPPRNQRQAEDQPTQNGDIVVTATRRAERLQDVPLSVTAFTQEELTDLGVVGYEGIAQNTPGVVINRPTQNFNNFTARGVNTNGYSAGLQSAVAIYVDELPDLRERQFDDHRSRSLRVERVEFLRGPQGNLSDPIRSPVPCASSPAARTFANSRLRRWSISR